MATEYNTLTPGEWVAEPGGINGDEPNRWCVLAVDVDDPNKKWFVAKIQNGAPGDSCATEERNARLIAASKELLAALQELSSFYAHWFDMDDGGGYLPKKSIAKFEDASDRAELAIAKATPGATP